MAIIDIAVEVKHVTEKAIKIYDGARESWIPISQIRSFEGDSLDVATSISIPEWLAKKNYLI